jgi:hypothetical protein
MNSACGKGGWGILPAVDRKAFRELFHATLRSRKRHRARGQNGMMLKLEPCAYASGSQDITTTVHRETGARNSTPNRYRPSSRHSFLCFFGDAGVFAAFSTARYPVSPETVKLRLDCTEKKCYEAKLDDAWCGRQSRGWLPIGQPLLLSRWVQACSIAIRLSGDRDRLRHLPSAPRLESAPSKAD